jgi:hypothetical protein
LRLSRAVNFEPRLVDSWVSKAQGRIDGQVSEAIVEGGGRRFAVRTDLVPDISEAPYGRFMVAWPDESDERVIHHLADSDFFLSLLELSYADALSAEPALREALRDGSRLEIAITNDVLQVQASGPPGRYSMIRHHALMHWAATAWLEPPAADRWFRLYDVIARHLSQGDHGVPNAQQLDVVEDEAFGVFERLASGTCDAEAARSVLDDEASLRPVLAYLRYAAAAIAVLERSRRQSSDTSTEGFLARELVRAYREPEYLVEEWQRQLG